MPATQVEFHYIIISKVRIKFLFNYHTQQKCRNQMVSPILQHSHLEYQPLLRQASLSPKRASCVPAVDALDHELVWLGPDCDLVHWIKAGLALSKSILTVTLNDTRAHLPEHRQRYSASMEEAFINFGRKLTDRVDAVSIYSPYHSDGSLSPSSSSSLSTSNTIQEAAASLGLFLSAQSFFFFFRKTLRSVTDTLESLITGIRVYPRCATSAPVDCRRRILM